jgi:hypothetical protein
MDNFINNRRFRNHEEFIDSLSATVKTRYIELFNYLDSNGFTKKLETTGYSVKIANSWGKLTPFIWIIGGGNVRDAETIIMPYDFLTGIDESLKAKMRTEILSADFPVKNNPKRDKWVLSASTTSENMNEFIAILENIRKIRTK